MSRPEAALTDPLTIIDWVNLYAMAVNERMQRSRVVTAPTNGAAGIVPSVIKYYIKFCCSDKSGIHNFLLTASAVGILFAENASLQVLRLLSR